MNALAAALQCPVSNAHRTVKLDNPGEGGEEVPYWCDRSRMRIGRAECARSFERQRHSHSRNTKERYMPC